MRRIALIAVCLLTGCATRPQPLPKVVHVPVTVYAPVPATLTAPCDEVAKTQNTVGEAVRLAAARLESIRKCNKDKARIKAIVE